MCFLKKQDALFNREADRESSLQSHSVDFSRGAGESNGVGLWLVSE